LPTIDRRTGEAGDLRHGRKTASTRGAHLRCRKQAPPALLQPRTHRVPSQPNRRLVDHAIDLHRFAVNGIPQT
jgi:hypothetical protein